MPKQTHSEIDQMIREARPTNQDLVRRDVILAIYTKTSNLILKIASYYYENGVCKELLCLCGTIACLYKGNQYNIPIDIYFQQDHPLDAPLVFVRPTPNMYISTTRNTKPDGSVIVPYLRNWQHPKSDLQTLLIDLSEVFGQSPP
ncbi:unnamed protein product, partial [Adineta steineri]